MRSGPWHARGEWGIGQARVGFGVGDHSPDRTGRRANPGARCLKGMKPRSFMVIAGEPSGDLLAAELVQALRQEFNRAPAVPTWDYQPLWTSLAPRFFGAGGHHMADAGVELAMDLTAHSVTGLSDVVKGYF